MLKAEIERLELRGFTVTPQKFKKEVAISCDQCQALAINGIPTHETGCPNQRHRVDCFVCGCEFLSKYKHRGQTCEDCLEDNDN